MIEKYFKDFDKHILKEGKPSTKSSARQTGKKTAAKKSIDVRVLKDVLSRIIPAHLAIDAVKPIDSSGFSPDGVDLIAYKKYCTDIIDLMGGYVPCELVYGLFHIIENLNKDTLNEALNKIATAKKINSFTADQTEMQKTHIPSFLIAAHMDYQFPDLKNDIINYYLSKNIEYQYELDILVILRKGVIVKNWREKRSFIALETKEDTNMWFYILMNEYLDINNVAEVDFRKYVKKEVIYNEY